MELQNTVTVKLKPRFNRAVFGRSCFLVGTVLRGVILPLKSQGSLISDTAWVTCRANTKPAYTTATPSSLLHSSLLYLLPLLQSRVSGKVIEILTLCTKMLLAYSGISEVRPAFVLMCDCVLVSAVAEKAFTSHQRVLLQQVFPSRLRQMVPWAAGSGFSPTVSCLANARCELCWLLPALINSRLVFNIHALGSLKWGFAALAVLKIMFYKIGTIIDLGISCKTKKQKLFKITFLTSCWVILSVNCFFGLFVIFNDFTFMPNT